MGNSTIAALWFVTLLLAALAAHQLALLAPVNAVIGVLLLCAAFGIHRRLAWARWLAVIFLWLAFVVGIGHMLPGRLEGLAPEEAPSLWIAGLQALLICGVAMLGLHLLGKHKSSFRSGWF